MSFQHAVRNIVEKYAAFTKPIDKAKFDYYEEQIDKENDALSDDITRFLYGHLICKAWPAITLDEYNDVFKENELIAWVLAFGRVIDHFEVSVYLIDKFKSLAEFNENIIQENIVKLNSVPAIIKGGEHCGIAQSSTHGLPVKIKLHDAEVSTHNSFLEFVWRYSKVKVPKLAGDFYLDFIPQNANYVIESLYSAKAI